MSGVWLDRGELEKLLHSTREVEADYERERDSRGAKRRPVSRSATLATTGTTAMKLSELFEIFD